MQNDNLLLIFLKFFEYLFFFHVDYVPQFTLLLRILPVRNARQPGISLAIPGSARTHWTLWMIASH